MIFPEATGQNLRDAGSSRSLKHEGGGDTQAIVQMVKYALSKYNGDANRVYSVGSSSGGIMTEALLGVYPDVFMAGVSLMGVPCGCWAQGYNDVTGSGGRAQWSGACAGAMPPRQLRNRGSRSLLFPYVQGTSPTTSALARRSDTTLNFKNMAEDIKQWTNVLGLNAAPSATDSAKSGTTHQLWKNACGYTVYETFEMAGVAHNVPFDGKAVAAYFGLDKAGGLDPEAAACAGDGGASSGTGGGAGAPMRAAGRGARDGGGGSSGTGGAAGGSGAPGAGGAAGAAVRDGGQAAGGAGSGDTAGHGGAANAGAGGSQAAEEEAVTAQAATSEALVAPAAGQGGANDTTGRGGGAATGTGSGAAPPKTPAPAAVTL